MSSALLAFALFLFFTQDPTTTTDQEITAAVLLPEVQLEAKNNLEPVPIPVLPTKTANSKTADLEHSASFRKAAEQAWRATRNGDAPYEAGFSIYKDGRPGKIQMSMFATVHAKTHLSIASTPTALGTLHVHTKYGEPTPSDGDIKSTKTLHKMMYVESRNGLYAIDPDGNVRHVFDDLEWFSKKGDDLRVTP
jgi:hypothetical protein